MGVCAGTSPGIYHDGIVWQHCYETSEWECASLRKIDNVSILNFTLSKTLNRDLTVMSNKMWRAGSPLRSQQANIPQLPTPQFKDSIPLLLSSLEALATSKQEFENTKKLLLDFANGEGQKLQAYLEAYADECRSKVNEFLAIEKAEPEKVKPTLHPDGSPFPNVHFLEATWEDMAYLAWQDSISCYSNVFTTMFGSAPYEQDPMIRAAWVGMGLLTADWILKQWVTTFFQSI